MSLVLKEEIVYNEELIPGIYKLVFKSDYISKYAKPGQFINIKCCDGLNAILRRPVSIASVDADKKTVTIFYQKKGIGTAYLAQKTSGDILDIIGPLGSTFDLSDNYNSIAIVGGGIGIFPLLFLMKQTKAFHKTAYIGFRSKNYTLLIDEFKENSNELLISTEDGSLGYNGFITDLLAEEILTRKTIEDRFNKKISKEMYNKKYDIIYACGPEPMLSKTAKFSANAGIKCQISLEQRMGCGIGACLACACKIKKGDDWQYKRVCKDGPVFWGEEVIFDE